MSRLSAFGLDRPELRAWALYDWANSAFVTSVLAVFYPIYFSSGAGQELAPHQVTERFAQGTTVALAISALLAPFLGTLADQRGWRKRLLAVSLSLALLATIALAASPPEAWRWGLLFFGLANIGASASFVFYDALLPHIARPEEVDAVSSAGYAAGYLGGGLMLLGHVVLITQSQNLGIGDPLTAMRWIFLSVALWWALFSLPLFFRVSEPPPLPQSARQGAWSGLRATFRELRQYDQALLMLAAFLIYNDGVGTIIRMTGVYGKEVGIDTNTLTQAFLLVQFLGIPCTFGFAWLAGRLGIKPTIGLTLGIYAVVTWVAYGMTTTSQFWLLAVLVASAQGGCQALSRSLFASMIPEKKSSQFFAFFAVAEKFAGVFGAAIFAGLVGATGSGRSAVLSLLLFFLVGGLLLSRVDVARGRAQAAAS